MSTDRRTWRLLTLLSVSAGAVAFGVMTGAPAGADETVVTFAATGGAQTWTVPADVTQVRVDAYGAQGGVGLGGVGGYGGPGGYVRATILVTPGETRWNDGRQVVCHDR